MSGPAPTVPYDVVRRESLAAAASGEPQKALAARLGFKQVSHLQQAQRRAGVPPRVATSANRAQGQRERIVVDPGERDRLQAMSEKAAIVRHEKSEAGTLHRTATASAKAVATMDAKPQRYLPTTKEWRIHRRTCRLCRFTAPRERDRKPDVQCDEGQRVFNLGTLVPAWRVDRAKKMRQALPAALLAKYKTPNYRRKHWSEMRHGNAGKPFSEERRQQRSEKQQAVDARLGRDGHYFAMMKRLQKATSKAAVRALLPECQTMAARGLVQGKLTRLGGRPQENHAGIIADLRAGKLPKQIARDRGVSLATVYRVRSELT